MDRIVCVGLITELKPKRPCWRGPEELGRKCAWDVENIGDNSPGRKWWIFAAFVVSAVGQNKKPYDWTALAPVE